MVKGENNARVDVCSTAVWLKVCQEVLNLKHLSPGEVCNLIFFLSFFVFQVRNEPKNIYIAAEYIAKIKGIPVEEVIEVTTQNALKVFPKLRNFVRV